MPIRDLVENVAWLALWGAANGTQRWMKLIWNSHKNLCPQAPLKKL
jgi:hypothetical protein